VEQQPDFEVFTDHEGRAIRLTDERWAHVLEQHGELQTQRDRIAETLADPDQVMATKADEKVHIYHRFYEQTPVTRKYLLVVVKILEGDAYVLTAHFRNQLRKGTIVWQR
jgi:hypothetical protein